MPSTIAVRPHPNRATSLRVACEKSIRALVSAMRRAVPGKAPPEAMNDLLDSFTDALERSAQLLLAGKHVRVVEDDETLTTQVVADLLDVSRPHMIKLLETEQIPQRATVGRHRRIARAAVLRYKLARDVIRGASLEELAAFSQRFGIGEFRSGDSRTASRTRELVTDAAQPGSLRRR